MNIFRSPAIVFLIIWTILGTVGSPVSAKDDPPEVNENPSMEDLFTLYQPYLGNIKPYEPIYFLVATKPEKSKFQFSFRYQLLDPGGPVAKNHPWIKGINFGYTQTSFWDLGSDSAPFEDTSYKPELFHLTDNQEWRPSWLKGLFLQTGLLHESNGRAEDTSRSTNIFYLKPVAILYNQQSGLGLQVVPKVWFYVRNSKADNEDLPDYRGYFELELKGGAAKGLVTTTALRWAKEGGSVQLDLDYPMPEALSRNLAIYLHFQYVNSLAESMLNYKERTEAFRFGISLIR